MKHNPKDHMRLGQQLRKATKQGDLSAAFRILQSGDEADAQQVLLRAGHDVIDTDFIGTGTGRKKAFWLFAQNQVAQACRQLCDGYEMQQIRRAAYG